MRPFPYQPDGCVYFVNGTKTFKYAVVFVESFPSEERALSLVAGLSVDLHSSELC